MNLTFTEMLVILAILSIIIYSVESKYSCHNGYKYERVTVYQLIPVLDEHGKHMTCDK